MEKFRPVFPHRGKSNAYFSTLWKNGKPENTGRLRQPQQIAEMAIPFGRVKTLKTAAMIKGDFAEIDLAAALGLLALALRGC